MKVIGYVTPKTAEFNEFKGDNPHLKFVRIQCSDDLRGIKFDVIIKGFQWFTMNEVFLRDLERYMEYIKSINKHK